MDLRCLIPSSRVSALAVTQGRICSPLALWPCGVLRALTPVWGQVKNLHAGTASQL